MEQMENLHCTHRRYLLRLNNKTEFLRWVVFLLEKNLNLCILKKTPQVVFKNVNIKFF